MPDGPNGLRGIVLAGGTGSRLMPLTRVTNKHLLPVGGAPMIFHPIGKLCEAGIRDLLVVTGRDHMGDVIELLGSGADLGVDITYRVQDEAGGIAQALGLARDFACGGPVCVVLADNIFEDDLTPHMDRFAAKGSGAMVLLKEVPDPGRFGVAELSADGASVVGIDEKPADPKGPLAVTGVYFYDAKVFDIVGTLKPSGRGELEITDVNNAYLERGELMFGVLEGEWTDAGTHSSYVRANRLARGWGNPERSRP
ncbi:MAG: sugar phosphate nucleotidyltransferase [Planctomycetota bacterium]|jgi:glucose-1-phosphate thymidylyltransferase